MIHRWASCASVLRRIVSAYKPPPELTVSEWADRYGVLTAESSAEPGRWRSYPYQLAIMDAFSHPLIERVTMMKSARVGFTKIIGHVIGYHMHMDPCSMMVVQPTIDDAEGWSKEDLQPMLTATPVLRRLVPEAKSRTSVNTITKKAFPGGFLHIVGANSARGFRRITVRLVLFDEVDGYPPTAGQEGDQIKLGTRRAETFWNRKIAIGSTPTVAGISRIEEHFECSSRGYFVLTCPDCGGEHVRGFRADDVPEQRIEIRGEEIHVSYLTWPDGEPQKAAWTCPDCGVLIGHDRHDAIMRRGYWKGDHWEWRDGKFEFLDGFDGHIGFHIWAGYSYSPNATPAHIAKEYLESRQDDDQLKTFVNTVLGRCWEERGETIDGHMLIQRREAFKAPCPSGVTVLTAGLDVQSDRVEAEVVGWGEGEQAWSIDHVILPGDPSRPEVWEDVADLLRSAYRHESGMDLTISGACIDSGYLTGHVYRFVREFRQSWVWPVKGMAGEGRPIVQPYTSRLQMLRKQRKRSQAEIVGVDEAKQLMYRKLATPGLIHFPMERDLEYFEQLTAEKLVIRYKRGRPVREWHQIRPRNEVLDCWIYALAALRLLDPDLRKLRARLSHNKYDQPETAKKPAPGLPNHLDQDGSLSDSPWMYD